MGTRTSRSTKAAETVAEEPAPRRTGRGAAKNAQKSLKEPSLSSKMRQEAPKKTKSQSTTTHPAKKTKATPAKKAPAKKVAFKSAEKSSPVKKASPSPKKRTTRSRK